MKQKNFSIARQLKSFTYAVNGIKNLILSEHNARIHLTATTAVIILSFSLNISKPEWLAVIFVTGFVWVTEMLNTCIEKILDFISTERKPEIKFIKDVAAASVLGAAFTALITGLIIFIPKIL